MTAWLTLALLPAWSGAAHAQPRLVEVALHLHCLSGVPADARVRLDYWSPGLARGNPDPDCVARRPLTGPLALQRVVHQHDAASTMELIWLELDPVRRNDLDDALRTNLRNVVAVSVQNRIVGVVFLTGSTTDHRIPIYVTNRQAAADLASDLTILLGTSR